jgi:hypothetical protein
LKQAEAVAYSGRLQAFKALTVQVTTVVSQQCTDCGLSDAADLENIRRYF